MASAWGRSWGRSWGNSWGLLTSTPIPSSISTGGAFPSRKRKWRDYDYLDPEYWKQKLTVVENEIIETAAKEVVSSPIVIKAPKEILVDKFLLNQIPLKAYFIQAFKAYVTVLRQERQLLLKQVEEDDERIIVEFFMYM